MLLKIELKGDSGHFYGNSTGIDLSADEIYKSNFLPCKTTILGMLCYYYGIEFDNLSNNDIQLKDIFINEFYFGALNKSKSLEKEYKTYSSLYHRSKRNTNQLFTKEYTKNIDMIIYIYINDNSFLEKYIKTSISNLTYGNIPGLGDKNLIPDIFQVDILNNNSEVFNQYTGNILTNVFSSKKEYYYKLGVEKENFLLSYNRINFNNDKSDFILGLNQYQFDFDLENEKIIIHDGKGIVLY